MPSNTTAHYTAQQHTKSQTSHSTIYHSTTHTTHSTIYHHTTPETWSSNRHSDPFCSQRVPEKDRHRHSEQASESLPSPDRLLNLVSLAMFFFFLWGWGFQFSLDVWFSDMVFFFPNPLKELSGSSKQPAQVEIVFWSFGKWGIPPAFHIQDFMLSALVWW